MPVEVHHERGTANFITAAPSASQHSRIMRSLSRATVDSDVAAPRTSSVEAACDGPGLEGLSAPPAHHQAGERLHTGGGSGRFPRKKLALHSQSQSPKHVHQAGSSAQRAGHLMAPLPRSPHSHLARAHGPAGSRSSIRRNDAVSPGLPSSTLPVKQRKQPRKPHPVGWSGRQHEGMGASPSTRDEAFHGHRDVPPLPPASPGSPGQRWTRPESSRDGGHVPAFAQPGEGRLGYMGVKPMAGKGRGDATKLSTAGRGFSSLGKVQKGSQRR
jgi:hypothetical protein